MSITLAIDVTFSETHFYAHLNDGRTLGIPIEWSPRLRKGTPQQRSNYRLIGRGIGINWPDLDEDLSLKGLLDGNPSIEYLREHITYTGIPTKAELRQKYGLPPEGLPELA
jgi:Protein of unknown function (DUF2442)